MSELALLEEKLNIKFQNKKLLEEAFTHRSYLNENPDWAGNHNERLEFLGDAVLELAVTEHLYSNFPDKTEGDLVNSNMLAELAQEIGLNDYLMLSRGEAKDLGRARQYILANTFEALVGAIHLDQGYLAAEKFIKETVLTKVSDVIAKKLFRDPKSVFQERAQEAVGITPTYEVMKEWGPDHNKHFIVGVYLGKELIAEGEGPSKQEAQLRAAEEGLRVKNWA